MSDPSDPPPPSPPPRRANYGWLWFFIFIFVSSIGVAAFMIWFNLWIQLTPEKLDEAWKVWKDKKILNYNMVYTKKLNDESNVETFKVEVRGGEVKSVTMNGEPLEKDKRPYHSMDRLFADIERFMEIDKKPGAPKVYVTAVFDDRTGCVRRYIRRVMGTTLRIELNVTLEPL